MRPRRELTEAELFEVERLLWLESGGDPELMRDDDENDPGYSPPAPIPEVAAREADRMHREYPAGS